MFGNIPGFEPLKVSSTASSQVVTTQNISRHHRMSPGEKITPSEATVRPAGASEPLEKNTVGTSKVRMTLMLMLLDHESETNSSVGGRVLQWVL